MNPHQFFLAILVLKTPTRYTPTVRARTVGFGCVAMSLPGRRSEMCVFFVFLTGQRGGGGGQG